MYQSPRRLCSALLLRDAPGLRRTLVPGPRRTLAPPVLGSRPKSPQLQAAAASGAARSRPRTGVDFKIKTVELRGKKIRLQIWSPSALTVCPPSVCVLSSALIAATSVLSPVIFLYNQSLRSHQSCLLPDHTSDAVDLILWRWCKRFNSITSAYYRSAKGIILVYDITKKETFDDLPKWMKMIDKYASEDAELLLVGNKLDCETDREISRQQGEKFAQQITGMRFCEASAKDNFNVDEIFLKLVDDILHYNHVTISFRTL